MILLKQLEVSQPQIFEAIKWWEEYLPLMDPHWKIKALHLYKIWSTYNGTDRRRFLSDFLNDIHGILEEFYSRHENFSPFNDWAFKLSYTIVFFHYIYNTFYINKRQS